MTATGWIVAAAAFAVAAVVFFLLGIRYRKRVAEKEISSAEEEATRIINEAIKSSESKKREALLEAKEEILKNRSEYEREVKERREQEEGSSRRGKGRNTQKPLRVRAGSQGAPFRAAEAGTPPPAEGRKSRQEDGRCRAQERHAQQQDRRC